MKITVINGSPKKKNSATDIMLEPLFNVAKDNLYEVNYIKLSEKSIKHCLGCYHCWFKKPGICVRKDDMAICLESMKNSDVIVYASPLYVDNITGLLKNFMDRTIPLADPRFDYDKNGECVHKLKNGVKHTNKIMVVSNCGFPQQTHFEPLKVLFKRVARNCKSNLIGEIYRGQGPLLNVNNDHLNPIIKQYKKLLYIAYDQVFKNEFIDDKIKKQLDAPLIPHNVYIEHVNKMFQERLNNIDK